MVRLTATAARRRRRRPVVPVSVPAADPDAPSPAEWSSMKEYGSFIVRDEDGEEHTFRKNDCAIILPHGRQVGEHLEMHEYWVGKIRDVRARSDTDVWTYVQWYWAPHEVHARVKSFDATLCSPYERVFSDTFDYVSTASFDATVPLHKLNDGDLLQPHIPWETFYTRYTFEHRPCLISPKPGEYSCICHVPYVPYAPTDPSTPTLALAPALRLMHYCPRPTCRRFFHATCLLAAACLDTDTDATSRNRRVLATSPDSGLGLDLGLGLDSSLDSRLGLARDFDQDSGRGRFEPLLKKPKLALEPKLTQKRGRGRRAHPPTPSPSPCEDPDADGDYDDDEVEVEVYANANANADQVKNNTNSTELSEILTTLPADLVRIATQPIVRGPVWPAGGVSGNLGAVVYARRVVYRAVARARARARDVCGGKEKEEKEKEKEKEREREKESGTEEEEEEGGEYALEGWEERVGDLSKAVVQLEMEMEMDGGGGKAKARRRNANPNSNSNVNSNANANANVKGKEKRKGKGKGRKGTKRPRNAVDDADDVGGGSGGVNGGGGALPFLCPQCGAAI